MISSLAYGLRPELIVLSLYNDRINTNQVEEVYDLGYFNMDGKGEGLFHYPRLLIPKKALDISVPFDTIPLNELDTKIENIKNIYEVLYAKNYNDTYKNEYLKHGFPSYEEYIRTLIKKLRTTISLNGTLPDNYAEILANPEKHAENTILPNNYLGILKARELQTQTVAQPLPVQASSGLNPQAKPFQLSNPTDVRFQKNARPSMLNLNPASKSGEKQNQRLKN